MIVESCDDLQVVGEAADGVEALESARRLTRDVVLMNIRMPRLDGLDATRRLLSGSPPHPRILVLTTSTSMSTSTKR